MALVLARNPRLPQGGKRHLSVKETITAGSCVRRSGRTLVSHVGERKRAPLSHLIQRTRR
jgi:hypothetical protein